MTSEVGLPRVAMAGVGQGGCLPAGELPVRSRTASSDNTLLSYSSGEIHFVILSS